MTALIAGSAADFARGASDPRTSSRAHLRRGLALSAALHLLLLVLVLRLTGGETIVRTYLRPADILLRPITELAPPLLPNATPPPVRAFTDEGIIEATKITPPSIPFDPIHPAGPVSAFPVESPGTPSEGREVVASAGPTGDPAGEVYRVVDELPVPVFAPTPTYPAWAREAGVTGRVLLEVLVGRDGRVQRVVLTKDDQGLGSAAEEALLRWVFRPARVNGAAVATWVAVPVVFRL